MRILWCGLILFMGLFSLSEEGRADGPIDIDLALNHIDVTTGFDGAYLIIYGSRHTPGDVAITVTGPQADMTVRKKNQVAGVWLNTQAVTFKQIPRYYSYALSHSEEEQNNAGIFEKYNVGVQNLKIDVKEEDADMSPDFKNALVRNKQEESLFPLKAHPVSFINDNLFKVQLYIPSNVPIGDYTVRALLYDGDTLLEMDKEILHVQQLGLSATIYQFSQKYSFYYGIVCVLIALLMGWLINLIRNKP